VSITTADIKQLRELTGAGILDCKKVLEETGGDVDKAIELLRRKGLAAASKKASREANEGLIGAWISADGRTGALLEVNCETDFVARTDDFKSLVDNLGRQVLEQPGVGNAEALAAAPYIGNQTKTVAEQITDTIAKLGENIMLRRVARFELEGDGMLDRYVHPNNRVGVLVDVAGGNSANPRFVELVHDLALHIAAAGPRFVNEADVPADTIEAERNIYRAQLAEDKKPENIKERIIDGKLNKWYSEVALLNQPFVKDGDLTIQQLLQKYSKELKGEIKVRRFARFELGTS
jgi:elongation factor Ts